MDREPLPGPLPRWCGLCVCVGVAVRRDPARQGGAAARTIRGRFSMALHVFAMNLKKGMQVSSRAVGAPGAYRCPVWLKVPNFKAYGVAGPYNLGQA